MELIDEEGEIAASWSFTKFLGHWMDKHSRVAFVPSQKSDALSAYRFGNNVRLAQGAAFRRLLRAIAAGQVFYDPGCRAAFDAEGTPIPRQSKRRNQWRVRFRDLDALYATMTPQDVTTVPADNTVSQRVLRDLGVILPVLLCDLPRE
ncbi:MvaI/BcnI restriction endonuclease family protein [Nocardioides sp. B-3]|uniref:MvaI/BcnI restriction endonuclease family protein n=1 Tax=Nocardioides sp. B-3 TaxID=2895565 RepID=UPI0021533959|nr:MvaI/BcnI restriction endonuclease family protein [Nocardioides sp. B-3]UUZ59595.1 MvaI/BcnI restriction endonuclease family protein [Nocardioides sp. B-3]